jgi:glutamate/tyrosine decarboxylase-like PLP-dependent enzyme
LQSLGRSGVADLVDRCCARARQFADALREIPGVEIANDVVINQIVVRFPGLDGVIGAVSESGACVVTPTTWRGEPGVRISVSNWQTTERDIEVSVDAIRAAVEQRQAASADQGHGASVS